MKIVSFTKISGEFDSAVLMSKHLGIVMTTQGIYENGNNFQEKDDWQLYNARKLSQKDEEICEINRSFNHPWICRTMFIVDRGYSKDYGTDQGRQRDRCKPIKSPEDPVA